MVDSSRNGLALIVFAGSVGEEETTYLTSQLEVIGALTLPHLIIPDFCICMLNPLHPPHYGCITL